MTNDVRRALRDALHHIERGTVPNGSRIRAWRELAGVPHVEGGTAAERGLEGSSRAARRWTDEESAQVDAAIVAVAAAARAAGRYFTTADVWVHLGPGFPVTKGIASKMTAAARDGIIANTGRHAFNDDPDRTHAHGQRLALWRPL